MPRICIKSIMQICKKVNMDYWGLGLKTSAIPNQKKKKKSGINKIKKKSHHNIAWQELICGFTSVFVQK